MTPRRLALVAALALVIGTAPHVRADWRDQGAVLTTIEENDLFLNTDRHYTQGFRQSFLHHDDVMPGFVRSLADAIPEVGVSERLGYKLGYEIGQSIFTPADLRATQLRQNDRPYAGWLYTGVILQRRWFLDGWPVLENFQIDAGIIGPHAFGKETQTWVHEFRGFETPKGWANQLHDEPGVAIKYQRSWLFSPNTSGARWIDFIPHAGFSLGNVDTSFRIGGAVRVGVNLPDDFGVSTISSLTTTEGGWSRQRTAHKWGFYVFLGTEASAVAYSTFLDGNLFRHSHSVEKEPVVGEWKAGIGVLMDFAELGLTYVYRTPQFVSQGKNDSYGSVSLKIKF